MPTAGHAAAAAAALLWGFLHRTLNFSCLAGPCLGILPTGDCWCDCGAGAFVAAFALIRSISSAALAVEFTVLLFKA
jgi:hypothetical protein